MIKQTTCLSSQESKKLKNQKIVLKIKRYINCLDINGNKLEDNLLPEQKEVLWNYYNAMRAGDGMKMNSLLSVLSYLIPTIKFGKYIKKPYNKVVKQDIINWISYLQHESDEKNRSMSITTMSYYRFLIKLFYRWLFQTGKEYPEVVDWIPEKTASRRILDDTTLISNSEIKELIKKCDNC